VTRHELSRITFLLFLLVLALLAFVTTPPRQVPEVNFTSHQPPEVEAPTGVLAEVFEQARPATLQIEMRNVQGLSSTVLGIGTGFFISPDGLVLTAYHVVEPQGTTLPRRNLRLVGVGPDEARYPLELIAFDAYFDLALLQAEVPHAVPYLELAERLPRVGSEVLAIGNSRGDFLQGRAGRVTGLSVAAPRADFAENTIELSTVLSPGDSGGPILNDRGEAVGVVSFISYMPGGSPFGDERFAPPWLRNLNVPSRFASYAIPATRDNEVLAAVLEGERRDVPVIGFVVGNLGYSPESSGVYLGPRPGVVVGRVEPGSPADAAGLRDLQERYVRDEQDRLVREVVADVIVAVNGAPTPHFYDLLAEVRRHAIGESVTLSVQRGEELVEVELVLAGRRTTFER
jgi:S1-C subfamily serine protease